MVADFQREFSAGFATDKRPNLLGEEVGGPYQDRSGFNANMSCGSAHSGAVNASFCDGSVRGLSYEIDQTVYNNLGGRNDGQVIDASLLE